MEIVQNRTGRDWIIAVRPWSFTTSSVAVLVTVAYLFYINCAGAVNGNIDWLNASLCLPFAYDSSCRGKSCERLL